MAEGGCGGNSAAPERRSPAAPPEYLEGGTEQKNILFLFRKNRSRAKSEKRRIFFCEVAAGALAEAGGGAGQFASKKVRAKDIISPHFIQIPILGGGCLGATRLGRRAKRGCGFFSPYKKSRYLKRNLAIAARNEFSISKLYGPPPP
ncbi:MAG: hypothetical protein A2782_03630 [Candidatus Blackburnbacteria bacterium RIFCSPHIGHO2_01_FULL_43_15b]|uniref:Uncharacterized protein n=1 Tax=Candidatus Blackburnbacteria bacterium RIFCSPHIGHO2_01_FULL_43_15b TaxID=1797513 RepID=A0A1G1UZF2_9BACT|nr:MAG: hypothetical protein A2782_03630 [Candidatus Blackburnbacteria bacterium RIFCSPHIGHO2_01_FULL_43_15b]